MLSDKNLSKQEKEQRIADLYKENPALILDKKTTKHTVLSAMTSQQAYLTRGSVN
jgi:hypothetical protein